MTETLTNELLSYLGELTYKLEHTFDWNDRANIQRRMNAVYVLLDIDRHEETWAERLEKIIKNKAA